MNVLPPVLVLNGPTASGKSALAIDLALALGRAGRPAEVVNADSMLVYRGMDIGTAKPTPAERHGVVHHLIDIMDVTDTATVAQFQGLARGAITSCRQRGVLPIVVGGSALYVHAIVDEFDFPGTDPVIRERYARRLDEIGAAALHAELAARAPLVAADILPGNGRRVVRALEVLDLTGSARPRLPEWTYALPGIVQVGLDLDRDELDRRIDQRVDRMWAEGLVGEVRRLETAGLRRGLTASRALGYRQVLEMFDGLIDEEEARRRTASGTRRFARKQLSWFRRDPRIVWLAAGSPDTVARVLAWLS